MKSFFSRAMVLVLLLWLYPFNSAVFALTVEEVSEYLMCQCGCNMTVRNCNHTGCPSATPMRAEIKRLIEQGKGRDEIIAVFASRYGETVMAVPTKSGFNITAWFLPFIAIIGGAAIISILLNAWVGGGKVKEETYISEGESEYDSMIEEDLKKID